VVPWRTSAGAHDHQREDEGGVGREKKGREKKVTDLEGYYKPFNIFIY
jgi:hypothetical protein